MNRSRRLLPLVVLLAASVVLGLAFVPAWLVHDRTLYGEGYRHLTLDLSAWKSSSLPVASAGVVAVAVAGLLALPLVLGRSFLAWPMALAAILGLALLAAAAVPLRHEIFATALELRPGWALLAALGVAAVAAVAAVVAGRPGLWLAVGLVVLLLTAAPLAAGARVVGLRSELGTGTHFRDGTYTHSAPGATPEKLTLHEGSYTIGQGWSGHFESRGLTIALVDDPACPDARGAYFVWGAGGEDIRFEKVVDTCADGARSGELTSGIWTRD